MDSNYYYCKCSICFENDSEMEFINCGDQYCFTCLERYVEYWIREGSWGLLPAELTCPVCGTEMLEDDWMPYISGRAIDLWHKFQFKRKETLKKLCISRPCPICNHSQSIRGSSQHVNADDFMIIGIQTANHLDTLDLDLDWRCLFDIEAVMDLMRESSRLSDLYDLTEFLDSCEDFFSDFLNLLEKLKSFGFFRPDQHDLIKLLIEFGRMFLRFISDEIESDNLDVEGKFVLINLELNFQMTFPFSLCDDCNSEFCLPCQQVDWFHSQHPQTSNNTRPDGSKQCPRCFVAIEREPDGCNEMRCNYCGLKFCWECGRKWSRDCGIYKCKPEQQHPEQHSDQNFEDNAPRSERTSNGNGLVEGMRNPEIGVPNVQAIHRERI